MKRVKHTKSPTPTQIENIVKNLKKAYPKGYIVVDYQNMIYKSGKYHCQFWVDVDPVFHGFISTWKALLDKYEKLMKEAKNG